MDKMAVIYAQHLPGFYVDGRGAYGIVLGNVYVCCFLDSDDFTDFLYDVTVDRVDENGDFALNIEWESFQNPTDAIKCLRLFVKKYAIQH